MSTSDEDVCAVLMWQWVQLACTASTGNERLLWIHPINKTRVQENTLKKFIEEVRKDEQKFRNFTRVSSTTFHYILIGLQEKLWKNDTNFRKALTPEERLFVTLRYLALGERFQSLHYYFRIGATTIGKIVEETCTALWDIFAPTHMKIPTHEKWEEVAQKFHRLWNFPNCLGAIDGKHIRIECPPNSGSSYFNYKNFHSIILQAVVDAEAKFLFVDVGDFGRNSDSSVLRNSSFGNMFFEHKLEVPPPRLLSDESDVELPFVFVADEAYPLSVNLMRPFPRKNLTADKRIFNYRLSRARRMVECAFGMVTKKFRVLENVLLVGPEKATKIVLACCLLHNIIREKEGTISDVHDALLECEENNEQQQNCNTQRTNSGLNTRMKFVHYFCSNEGAVPWQNKYAHI